MPENSEISEIEKINQINEILKDEAKIKEQINTLELKLEEVKQVFYKATDTSKVPHIDHVNSNVSVNELNKKLLERLDYVNSLMSEESDIRAEIEDLEKKLVNIRNLYYAIKINGLKDVKAPKAVTDIIDV